MEVGNSSIVSTEHSTARDMDVETLPENIVPNHEISDKNSADDPSEDSKNQNSDTPEHPTENNNTEEEDDENIPDSPEGEYIDKDLVRSMFSDRFSRQPPNYLQSISSAENSDHSEFDISDEKEDFEIWSSDSSSPGVSDDSDTPLPSDYWKEIQQDRMKKFEFTGKPLMVEFDPKEKFTPFQCFKLFVNDAVINLLVTETNKFARSKFVRPGYHKDFLTGWIDVTPQEMRQFIGLLIFMTCRRFPGTKYYWSGDKDFNNPVAGRVMTETRFKRLLTFWHFGDDKDGDYSKIRNLLNILNEIFKTYREPEQTIYVGKATLFLRDKYAFQRGLIGVPRRGKRLLKLLDSEIYTYKVVIMPPENCDNRVNKTKEAVLNLLQDYLNEGRHVVFHNFCVSVDMAQELLNNKTHVIGPIRKKSRNTPIELRHLKLKNNEVKGFQNSDGIAILKWKTWGQTSYGLSTCHGTETVKVEKLNKRQVKEQPKFLRDFNLSDKVFDLAEKFSVTESPLNNETKWYRRLANDLLTGTCVSNAFCLYKKINNDKMKFHKFQDQLWKEMVGFKSAKEPSSEDTTDEEG